MRVVKRNVWILKFAFVSGTFADLDQDPDLPCLLIRKEPVKAPKREV